MISWKQMAYTLTFFRTNPYTKSSGRFKIVTMEFMRDTEVRIDQSMLRTSVKLSPSGGKAKCFLSRHDFWQQLLEKGKIVTPLSCPP